jgi:hypothetical protein
MAVLMVFAAHVPVFVGLPQTLYDAFAFPIFGVGVDLFFVISGYVTAFCAARHDAGLLAGPGGGGPLHAPAASHHGTGGLRPVNPRSLRKRSSPPGRNCFERFRERQRIELGRACPLRLRSVAILLVCSSFSSACQAAAPGLTDVTRNAFALSMYANPLPNAHAGHPGAITAPYGCRSCSIVFEATLSVPLVASTRRPLANALARRGLSSRPSGGAAPRTGACEVSGAILSLSP